MLILSRCANSYLKDFFKRELHFDLLLESRLCILMQVVLTDGDASSLENLKLNLEMNKIENLDVSLDKSDCSLCTVSFDL